MSYKIVRVCVRVRPPPLSKPSVILIKSTRLLLLNDPLKMFSLICSFRWTILSLPISASLQTMVTTTSTSPTNKSASSSPINTSQYLDLPSESFRADVGECSYCFSISSVGTCKLKRLWIMGLLSTGSGMGERAEVGVT